MDKGIPSAHRDRAGSTATSWHVLFQSEAIPFQTYLYTRDVSIGLRLAPRCSAGWLFVLFDRHLEPILDAGVESTRN